MDIGYFEMMNYILDILISSFDHTFDNIEFLFFFNIVYFSVNKNKRSEIFLLMVFI